MEGDRTIVTSHPDVNRTLLPKPTFTPFTKVPFVDKSSSQTSHCRHACSRSLWELGFEKVNDATLAEGDNSGEWDGTTARMELDVVVDAVVVVVEVAVVVVVMDEEAEVVVVLSALSGMGGAVSVSRRA